jgi:YbbR domain-containing protein
MRVGSSPLGWIVNNWRLKLLSVVLAAGLLTAVGLSADPPELATIPVHIAWTDRPPGLVVMNPPSTVQLSVYGVHDAVEKFRQTAAGATVNLSGAQEGANQTFYAIPNINVSGVQARQASIPVHVSIERVKTVRLDIEVRALHATAGSVVIADKTFATCGNANERCQVAVSGAATVVDNLKAYVNYDVTINSGSTQVSPGQPVFYEYQGRAFDLSHPDPSTLPELSHAPDTVTVQVASQGGTGTKTVGVTVAPVGSPPCGYAVTGLDVAPAFVNVSGSITDVSKLTVATTDPINLGGMTSNTSFTRRVLTGSSQVVADPNVVRVTVSVAQAFTCGASQPPVGVPPATAAPAPPAPTPSPTP